MALIFEEPETFKTPDGAEYIILPLSVDDMEPMFQLIEKRDKLVEDEKKKQLAASAKTKKQKGKKKPDPEDDQPVQIDGKLFLKTCGKEINEIIPLSVLNIKTGEPFPRKYWNPQNQGDLIIKIMKITMPKEKVDEEDGIPLELPKT